MPAIGPLNTQLTTQQTPTVTKTRIMRTHRFYSRERLDASMSAEDTAKLAKMVREFQDARAERFRAMEEETPTTWPGML